MTMTNRRVALAGMLVLLTGCGSVGRYRGAEPFGGKPYVVAPPVARLTRPVKVVLLVFKDERPAIEYDLEWTRQASNIEKTRGTVKEVRGEFERAIRSGLAAHRQIELVSSETFAQNQTADMIISGRILRCDVDRKMGWSGSNFIADSVIEVVLRDGRGAPLTARPIQYAATAQISTGDRAVGSALDDNPVGLVGAALEESIRLTVQSFMTSREMSDALQGRR